MLTLNDIINITFRKSGFSGYRTDDVDNFVDQVRDSFEFLSKQGITQKEATERAESEKQELLKKLEILAAKVEEYRLEENEIKSALVSAQKLGDASVREARHKAEIITKDAQLKGEKIIAGANDQVSAQHAELEALKRSVSDFRASLLDQYKRHLTMIDALPSEKDAPPAPGCRPSPSGQPLPQEAAPAAGTGYTPGLELGLELGLEDDEQEFLTEPALFAEPEGVYAPQPFEEVVSTGSTTRFNAIRMDDDFSV